MLSGSVSAMLTVVAVEVMLLMFSVQSMTPLYFQLLDAGYSAEPHLLRCLTTEYVYVAMLSEPDF